MAQPEAQQNKRPFGLVLKCPKCPPKDAFAMLKIPSTKAIPCPNCGSRLVPSRPGR